MSAGAADDGGLLPVVDSINEAQEVEDEAVEVARKARKDLRADPAAAKPHKDLQVVIDADPIRRNINS